MKSLSLGLVALSLCSISYAKSSSAKKAPAPKKAVVMCPVGNTEAMTGKNDPKSVYKGKTYWFCCPECKPAFDKEPEKYLKLAKKKSKTTGNRIMLIR